MSSEVLREEFEVQQLGLYMVLEIFSPECPHLGLGVHLPNRAHKFVHPVPVQRSHGQTV